MNQVMYVKVLLWLLLAIILKRINGQSSTCGQPTPPHGSTIIYPLQQNKHNSGSVVLFGCKEGFYLVGIPLIRCTGNTWTTIKFRCLGFCPDIGHILNGQVLHVTPKVGQAAVVFHCNKTHRLIGKPRLECIKGRWNGSLPFCKRMKSCAPLWTPGNGTLHGSDTSHGAKASFACLTGFDLFGSRTLTCSNGVWNAITPTCKAQCQKITDPLNGRKYGTRFSHGAIASFECKVGYKLVGSRSLLCVDGKWNASVPVCNAMLCPRPPIPQNSYIIYPGIKDNYVHGIKLFLGCHNGYYLTGSPIMDCNQTVWSKVEFRCIAACPVIGQLKNGIITHVTLRNGGEVGIKCLTNYTLDGSSKLFCRNGKWSDSLPTCGAPCSEPVTPQHGRRLGGDFMHGQSVKFYCDRGYHRIGASSIICNDGKWDKQSPLCKVSECGGALGMENYTIPDSRITSPAPHYFRRSPRHARLNGHFSWCAVRQTYLQIDLGKTYKVTSLATQGGRTDTEGDKWVKQYKVSFFAGATRVVYRESGLEKSIQGNSDASSVVIYQLKEPFVTRYLRIYPGLQLQPFCLRMEIYGCNPNPECILPGSVYWGLWSRKDNSFNYYKAFITKITASHINFILQINNAQWRSYKRTEPVLVIDKIPEMKEISVNSSVIAVHKRFFGEWYRAGNVAGTNERLSLVYVRFKNVSQRWVPLNKLRLVKRPKFCVDGV